MSDGISAGAARQRKAEEQAKKKWGEYSTADLRAKYAWYKLSSSVLRALRDFIDAHYDRHVEIRESIETEVYRR